MQLCHFGILHFVNVLLAEKLSAILCYINKIILTRYTT